jgi:hypothetical protein
MAQANVKTEMKGTTSRWLTRAEVKTASKKIRRLRDKQAVKETE